MIPLAFGFAPTDIAIVALVVVVLFGGSKLAGLGKSAGEGIKEFKKATREDDPPATVTQTPAPTPAANTEEKS